MSASMPKHGTRISVPIVVEGTADIWDQLEQGRARFVVGKFEEGLCLILIAWHMLDDRLPRMLAVQAECTRLCSLATERMQALPMAEQTVRLRRNNEEQARIDARVTEMQGMMQSIEDDFLLVQGVSDIGPEFEHTIDTIKQRRSVHEQSGV